MSKISSKGIQTFVAGALSLPGFDSLIQVPRDVLVFNSSFIAFCGSIVPSLGLLIGLAILFGSERAIFWARIYLLLEISCVVLMDFIGVFRILPDGPSTVSWWSALDFLSPAILFALLGWSRSKRFKDETIA